MTGDDMNSGIKVREFDDSDGVVLIGRHIPGKATVCHLEVMSAPLLPALKMYYRLVLDGPMDDSSWIEMPKFTNQSSAECLGFWKAKWVLPSDVLGKYIELAWRREKNVLNLRAEFF